ncbi:hypothetical protein DY000_02032967 [Brassica cretica]|uniref:Uncharacterized protein n=1 Tax=Brassica cretica TaxID=69181 RepID=A0ABQ7DTZ2_BRACR|nr:hypothetical protein DY000_02032967 [Brassica cretica]
MRYPPNDDTLVRDVSVPFRFNFLLPETVMGFIDSVPLMTSLTLLTIQWSGCLSTYKRVWSSLGLRKVGDGGADGTHSGDATIGWEELDHYCREIPDSINIHVVKVRIKFVTLFDYNLDVTQRMQLQRAKTKLTSLNDHENDFGWLDRDVSS